jgi:hypothetical protein
MSKANTSGIQRTKIHIKCALATDAEMRRKKRMCPVEEVYVYRIEVI